MLKKLLRGFIVALVLTLSVIIINEGGGPDDPPITGTNNIVHVVQIG